MARQFGSNPSAGDEKLKIALAIGVFLVGLAGVILFVVLNSSDSNATAASTTVPAATNIEPQIEMVEVIVPAVEIQTGTALSQEMFRVERRPMVGLPSRTVRSFDEIVGKYAKSLILADQPLRADTIGPRPTSFVTANIPEGYRAVSIRVNSTSSVEGWAQPGARVDVQWIGLVNGTQGISTIVENAKVLSADRNTNGQGGEGAQGSNPEQAGVPNTVTLVVTAEDAAKIQLAQSSGTLSLVLRGEGDQKRSDAPAVIDANSLIFKKPQEKNQNVVIVRGPDGKKQKLVLKDEGLVPVD